MNRFLSFVINLLCLMTHEPEIISVQSPPSKYTVVAKSKGFGSQKVNNVPNVHWLGEYFTTRVVDSKTKEGEPQDVVQRNLIGEEDTGILSCKGQVESKEL